MLDNIFNQLHSPEFDVVVATTPQLKRQAHRVRHQVYCLERGFEPGVDDLEIDEFDEHSVQSILTDHSTGDIVGAVRLVLPVAHRLHDCLPMQRACGRAFLSSAQLASTGEVSRFSLSKSRRKLNFATTSLMRLGLLRGIVEMSWMHGLTHWCALMEPGLLRLLRMSAVHFQPAGPMIEHHGLRQPTIGRIDAVLDRIRADKPEIWNYITEGGLFVPAAPQRRLPLRLQAAG